MGNKEKMSFEQMMDRIKEITELLQSREVGLEESINLYQEGMNLVRQCYSILERAEEKIKKISESGNSYKITEVDPDSLGSGN